MLWRKLKITSVAVVLGLSSVYFLLAVYVGLGVNDYNPVPADAIVVLGARSYRNGDYNPCLVARVEKGIELYRQGLAKKLIFTGGNDTQDSSNEASVMQAIALDSGVESDDLLLEPTATSTFENLSLSLQLLNKHKFNSIILVTEGFHMRRASLVADSLEISHTVAPANDSPCWQTWKYGSRYFLREPLVLLYYIFRGYIQLT